MELKDIWSKQNWEESEFDYRSDVLLSDIKAKSKSQIEQLLRLQWRAFYSNIAFMIIFLGLYFVHPTREFLIPIAIVTFCYVALSGHLGYKLFSFKKPDLTGNLSEAIRNTLRLVKSIGKTQKQYSVVFMPLSTMAGFFMGFILSGNSLARLYTEPLALGILITILILMALFGYRFAKLFSRKKCSTLIKELEEQLEYLEH